MLSVLFFLNVAVPEATAGAALEPQNRIHLGLSMVDSPNPAGVSFGFDSRLTGLLAMDIGVFLSPGNIPDDYVAEVDDDHYGDNFRLRHGLYFMPGLRIRHPQPRNWAWEVFVRGGAGVLWTANVHPDVIDSATSVRPGAGGTLGLDGFVRFGQFGVRAYGRGWVFGASRLSPDEKYVLVRPHWGVEGLVQW